MNVAVVRRDAFENPAYGLSLRHEECDRLLM